MRFSLAFAMVLGLMIRGISDMKRGAAVINIQKNGLYKEKNVYLAFFLAIFFIGTISTVDIQGVHAAFSEGISITASVPVSLEYAFSLRKNSSVVFTRHEAGFVVQGTVRGPMNLAQENHKILLQIQDAITQSLVFEILSETDQEGVFSFTVPLSVEEKNVQFKLSDLSFESPFVLMSTSAQFPSDRGFFDTAATFFRLTQKEKEL